MSSLLSLLPKPKNIIEDEEDEYNAQEAESSTLAPTKEEDTKVALLTSPSAKSVELLKYEALARIGHSEDRLIQTQLSDLQPKYLPREHLARPTPEEIAAETEVTRQAIQALVAERAAKTQPKNVTSVHAGGNPPPQLVKYTSNPTMGNNNTSMTRIVKMMEMPKDPLEPPKFHHKRIPRPPPSPPAPRLHSPPRKVTAEEQRSWRIPPCVSSWKNPKGYTIPLDKRLASDGKALQEKTLNSRIADMAEALYLAEKHTREEVEMRAAVERKLAEQEQRRKDEELERMAIAARRQKERHNLSPRQRERQRREEERESRRIARLPAEQRRAHLLAKVNKEEEERRPEYDQAIDDRVFDRTGGLGTGFGGGDDDVYNLYDRPLLSGTREHLIYRPTMQTAADNSTNNEDEEAQKHRLGGRSIEETLQKLNEGPLQFQRGHTIGDEANGDKAGNNREVEEDPFGLDKFLTEAKRGRKL